ncbi:MAG: protoporphyrinogen oxidase [Peptococcaceae bacterium]|nr:protoporphyrinogen oxidase [Peptococcaceae bacterium]
MQKVVIVGGGITGLTAAYYLQEKAQQAGIEVDYLLLEQGPRLGGKIVTETENGFVVEGGPDCFIREKPAVLQLAAKLGISDKLLPSNDASTGTFVLSGGKLHQLPDGLMILVPTKIIPFALSPLITWPGKLRMGLDLILPRKKTASDESLGSFVTRRLGKEALDKIGEPLIGGIHGGNSQTMSLKASFPRFIKMEEEQRSLIVAMLKARAKAPKPAPPKPGEAKKTYFMSFKGGMQDLIAGLAASLAPEKLVSGVKVEKITARKGGGYSLALAKGETIEADAVILTTPAWDTAELLTPLDTAIAQELLNIPQASSATITLIYRKQDVKDLGSFGFVIPASEGRQINALTFTSVKWNHRVPNPDFVSLRTFVGGGRNQELASLPDTELVQIARAELADILGIQGEPVYSKVHHWIQSRPQYVLGHLDGLTRIEARLKEHHAGLSLAGASYRGIGVPDCVNDGERAATDTVAFLHQTGKSAAR